MGWVLGSSGISGGVVSSDRSGTYIEEGVAVGMDMSSERDNGEDVDKVFVGELCVGKIFEDET